MTIASADRFPLPFHSLRVVRGGESKDVIFGAMFTATYAEKAARLAASCEKFALPYEFHEVPTVHCSTSIHGAPDPSFTKANFIHHLLQTHQKPVLYLDADCEILAQPDLIMELVQARCDFAVYNWLADEYTDMFKPLKVDMPNSTVAENRFFRFAGTTRRYSTTQLRCSGLVQFYANSLAARSLLAGWHKTVMAFSGCADDECLDFAYNNRAKRSWSYWFLKTRWLPKAYARIAVWIYAKPVINHRDYPAKNSHFVEIKDPRGRQTVYWSQTKEKNPVCLLPRDQIVDTQDGLLCSLTDGKLVPVGKTEENFWV